ncbi:hypothetical protein [[Clostridium] innocuum]|uniref:Uncharacterized protein n=1 Tax=Clostridium innocuum TaxID=1522 RepID=A0A6N2XEE1_CLOIN|nr:hypothetical protein HMPREF9022_04709 [Erysipelotrichaceae bacterium 2_2_44A]EHO23131.1 hypothetical protein HMPREF0981_03515 [Erysipelotrichaceae bacterium 6_1_45]MBV4069601.1 hypothetical protein [[Clostridium] innocuum]RJV84595.1 hypothetical protein DWX45_18500 [Erysipelotrichaceae bacterium AF19-24AC]
MERRVSGIKKEYLALYRHINYPDQWENAKISFGGDSRYCETLEEAKMYIKKVKKGFNVETKIKVREVTKWKELQID